MTSTSVRETPKFPSVGDTLAGRYELTGVIARGGMGMIMRARQLAMDRDVAVKMLLPHVVGDETLRLRFEREVHLAKQLNHPNIIQLFDYGNSAGGVLYLVMELLEGEDLKTMLAREQRLPLGRALDVLEQVVDALTEAHRQNIVHRDLKPSNIFVTRRSRNRALIKVLDFGIAKSLDANEVEVTMTGQVCGTSAYLAPEAILSREAGKPADVYSAGLIFAEMLLGRKVFEGATVAQTLVRQLKQPVPIPRSLRGTPVEAFIEAATAKHPEDRLRDADAMMTRLEALRGVLDPELRISSREADEAFEEVPHHASLLSQLLEEPEQLESLRRLEPLSNDVVPGPDDSFPPHAPTLTPSSTPEGWDDTGPTSVAPPPEMEAGGATGTDVTVSVRPRIEATQPDIEPLVARRRPAVALLALAALVLSLGVLAFAVGGEESEPPETPELSAEPLGYDELEMPGPVDAPAPGGTEPRVEATGVYVTSEPEHADVYVEGVKQYRTPVRAYLDAPETWEVRREGYRPAMVEVSPDRRELHVVLEPRKKAAPRAERPAPDPPSPKPSRAKDRDEDEDARRPPPRERKRRGSKPARPVVPAL